MRQYPSLNSWCFFLFTPPLLKKLFHVHRCLRNIKLNQDFILSNDSPKFEPYYCMQITYHLCVLHCTIHLRNLRTNLFEVTNERGINWMQIWDLLRQEGSYPDVELFYNISVKRKTTRMYFCYFFTYRPFVKLVIRLSILNTFEIHNF